MGTPRTAHASFMQAYHFRYLLAQLHELAFVRPQLQFIFTFLIRMSGTLSGREWALISCNVRC